MPSGSLVAELQDLQRPEEPGPAAGTEAAEAEEDVDMAPPDEDDRSEDDEEDEDDHVDRHAPPPFGRCPLPAVA